MAQTGWSGVGRPPRRAAPSAKGTSLLALTLAAALVAGPTGCGHRGEGVAEVRRVEEAVRQGVAAENAGDVGAFLALWTDDGLRSYDAGTRDELLSGQASLGGEKTEVRGFVGTTVKGGKAVSTVDGAVEIGLYRMRYDLVRKGGRWLLDGFRFLGPAPPALGTTIVDVKAVDYAYDLDRSALAGGDVAIHFSNAGQEQHEISILLIPAGATTAEAVLALAQVHPTTFAGVPAGYGALGHLAYAGPGEDGVYTIARKLEPGRYALACFLPVGGVNQAGGANVADAESHVARGMLADFTVG